MKILQLVQKPQRRGAEIFALQLSRELHRQGHDVRTAYLYPHRSAESLPLAPDDYLLSGKEHHPFEKLPGFHPDLLRGICQVIDDFGPDTVQVNGARTVKYGAFAKSFGRTGQWRLVYRNIDNPTYWVRDGLHRWFYRRLVMPRIDGVIGVSETTLHAVHALYGLSVPSRFIPNGIDPVPLEATPAPEIIRRDKQVPPECSVVLFMGSLTEQKRPDRFLRVLRSVYEREPNIQGWILGDGPLRAELESLARNLGLLDVVRFWGYQREVAPYITASDLVVVTSDSDGIPAVVLEAGYLGKPVVATRVGGLAECVVDGDTGRLVEPKDETALAQAVLELLRNSQLREAMGNRATKWIRGNFTMDTVGRQYLEFYQEVLSR
jgi:glycosyltransferase involved in cell wall biosynthesis